MTAGDPDAERPDEASPADAQPGFEPESAPEGSLPEPAGEPSTDESDDPSQTIFLAGNLQRGLQDEATADEDPQGWQTLVDKIEAFVRRVHSRTRLPRTYELQDLQQVVLAKMVNDLARMQLRTREEFWGYVRRVAEHSVRDMWRRLGAQKRGSGVEPVSLSDSEGGQREDVSADIHVDSPSVFIRRKEIGDREQRCVAEIPNEEHRNIYEMRRFEGLDYAEIVDRLGGTRRPETVRVLYHRTRQRVHECLRRYLQGYSSDSLSI